MTNRKGLDIPCNDCDSISSHELTCPRYQKTISTMPTDQGERERQKKVSNAFSNPMSSIGYGRGDDVAEEMRAEHTHYATPPSRKTMAYSFVAGTAHAPSKTLPSTNPVSPKNLPEASIESIVSELVEKHVTAWLTLPKTVRKLMLSDPSLFILVISEKADTPPHIVYADVEFRYSPSADAWIITNIL
jgi:hypothetical protein